MTIKSKEPNTDSFVFHVTDGVNQSPTYNFIINIEVSLFHFIYAVEKIRLLS